MNPEKFEGGGSSLFCSTGRLDGWLVIYKNLKSPNSFLPSSATALKININSLMDWETVAKVPSHPFGVMCIIGIFRDPRHHSCGVSSHQS